jgi:ribonuclease D
LDQQSQQLLKHLAVWRERTAQRKDLPRNWVVDDNQLIDIAAAKPRDREQLMEIEGIPSQLVHRYGNAVLSVIDQSQRRGCEDVVWGPPARLSDRETRLADRLITIIRTQAQTERISPTLVASRKEVQRFVRQPHNHPLVTGWRYELIGRSLLQELEAKQDH